MYKKRKIHFLVSKSPSREMSNNVQCEEKEVSSIPEVPFDS